MPEYINGKVYYRPSEAAAMLGISLQMLKYYRQDRTLLGSITVGSITYYSDEDIKAGKQRVAQPRKRGPKKRNQTGKDGENGGRNSSVTYPTTSLAHTALEATA